MRGRSKKVKKKNVKEFKYVRKTWPKCEINNARLRHNLKRMCLNTVELLVITTKAIGYLIINEVRLY